MLKEKQSKGVTLKRPQATIYMDDETMAELRSVATLNDENCNMMGYYIIRDWLGLPPIKLRRPSEVEERPAKQRPRQSVAV